ncbi:MAG: A24 family peptidase, partial [Cyanobacteria bacterium J06555_12]
LLLRLGLPLLDGSGTAAIAPSLLDGAIGMTVGILSLEAIGWIGLLVLGKEAMGGGDGKLMAAVGLWLGWRAVLVSIFVACLLGTAIGIALKLVRGKQWSKPIPFGPYLVLGAVTALFFGPQLVDWYWNLAVVS